MPFCAASCPAPYKDTAPANEATQPDIPEAPLRATTHSARRGQWVGSVHAPARRRESKSVGIALTFSAPFIHSEGYRTTFNSTNSGGLILVYTCNYCMKRKPPSSPYPCSRQIATDRTVDPAMCYRAKKIVFSILNNLILPIAFPFCQTPKGQKFLMVHDRIWKRGRIVRVTL